MDSWKVAIVDDNEIFRAGLRFFIETKTNWEILCEASSGNEFVEKGCDSFPDLVFMDINMPGLNGLQTTFKYMSEHSRHNIKVIAVTMYAYHLQLQSLLEAGFKGCILKKDVYNELIPAAEKVMNQEMYFAPIIDKHN